MEPRPASNAEDDPESSWPQFDGSCSPEGDDDELRNNSDLWNQDLMMRPPSESSNPLRGFDDSLDPVQGKNDEKVAVRFYSYFSNNAAAAAIVLLHGDNGFN